MKTRAAHSLPGRLRLTAEGLRYLKEESPAIAAELASIPGVQSGAGDRLHRRHPFAV